MELVLQCGFQQTDAAAINNALASSCFKLAKDRRKQQDYSAMYDYFSAADWKVLSNPAVNQNTKIATVAARGIALGGRCPTEHTFKAWTSLIMALEGQESYMMTSPGDKKKSLEFVKEEFRRFGRRAGKPILWLQKLSAVPSDLPPELYAQAFADGDPVVCQMPGLIAEANKIDMSFGCRGGRSDLEPAISTLNLSPAGGSAVQDIACVMMQGMQQMVQQQNQMMHFMMGGGPSTVALSNVRGMMGRQSSFGAARPMLQFGAQVLPPQECDSEGTPSEVATPRRLALPPPPQEAVNSNTVDLLKMLDEREAGKQNAEQEATTKAKVESPPQKLETQLVGQVVNPNTLDLLTMLGEREAANKNSENRSNERSQGRVEEIRRSNERNQGRVE